MDYLRLTSLPQGCIGVSLICDQLVTITLSFGLNFQNSDQVLISTELDAVTLKESRSMCLVPNTLIEKGFFEHL